MVDENSLQLCLESFKAAGSLAVEAIKLSRNKDISAKIMEMNTKIMEAQNYAIQAQREQFSLVDEIKRLKIEISEISDFREEKERYELLCIGNTAFVYVIKPEFDTGDIVHWLCSTCFENNRKSILQLYVHGTLLGDGLNTWKCHTCTSEIKVHTDKFPIARR